MKNISIEYFALLRDQRGVASENLQTACLTPKELYGELAERHRFTLETSSLKVAVNDDFAAWDRPLEDGDRVVFIPPVAGG